MLAIEAREVRRTFGSRGAVLTALDGVTLSARPGEIFGLLGPNGAGKTTLIKIFTTLLYPTEGTAAIMGHDVVREAEVVRRLINLISGGERSGYGLLTVEENLWLFSQLYGVEGRLARERVARLLDVVELKEERRRKVNRLSSGQHQRMSFARGFVNEPQVLFMDEPTLGLDVNSAIRLRKYMRDWVAATGHTILLTTHYLAEADQCCDRIAIIHKGRILACDTPAGLKRLARQEPLFHLTLRGGGNGRQAEIEVARTIPGVRSLEACPGRERDTHLVRVILEGDHVLPRFFERVSADGYTVVRVEKREPSLEEAFLELVGEPAAIDVE